MCGLRLRYVHLAHREPRIATRGKKKRFIKGGGMKLKSYARGKSLVNETAHVLSAVKRKLSPQSHPFLARVL